jgi:hypothetical protein
MHWLQTFSVALSVESAIAWCTMPQLAKLDDNPFMINVNLNPQQLRGINVSNYEASL